MTSPPPIAIEFRINPTSVKTAHVLHPLHPFVKSNNSHNLAVENAFPVVTVVDISCYFAPEAERQKRHSAAAHSEVSGRDFHLKIEDLLLSVLFVRAARV